MPLTVEQYREIMGAVRTGKLKLLYAAPERFNNERFRDSIQRIRVSLFAVDEAHCISEWGHNFRPDYLKLAAFGKLCEAERVLALTATTTPKVLEDICTGFEIEPDHAIRTGFYRPNLELDGFIEVMTPYYSSYRFREIEALPEIAALFNGERPDFVEGLFALSKKRKTWAPVISISAIGGPLCTRLRGCDQWNPHGYAAAQRVGLVVDRLERARWNPRHGQSAEG